MCCVYTVARRQYQLIDVSADGYATLLDVVSGAVDTSMRLPPAEALRRNTTEETEQYAEIIAKAQAGDSEVFVTVLSAMGMAAVQPVLTAEN